MGFGFARMYNYLRRRNTGERFDSAVHSSSSDFPSTDRGSTRFQLRSEPADQWLPSRRVERKWRNREERRVVIDGEYDMVIVPSDCCCWSGSESNGSDWSVGWMEPHAPEFQADSSDAESNFAVLVPCYSNVGFEKKIGNHQQGFYYEDEDFIQKWLAYLQE